MTEIYTYPVDSPEALDSHLFSRSAGGGKIHSEILGSGCVRVQGRRSSLSSLARCPHVVTNKERLPDRHSDDLGAVGIIQVVRHLVRLVLLLSRLLGGLCLRLAPCLVVAR